jgi:hypothetical protein
MRLSTRLLCRMGRSQQRLSAAQRSCIAREHQRQIRSYESRSYGKKARRQWCVWCEASIMDDRDLGELRPEEKGIRPKHLREKLPCARHASGVPAPQHS